MATSKIPSFRNLNDSVKELTVPASIQQMQTALALYSQPRDIAQNVASEYARSYAGVQTLQYDADGNVEDVTTQEACTVPKSIVAKALAQLGDWEEKISSLEIRALQAPVAKCNIEYSLYLGGKQILITIQGASSMGSFESIRIHGNDLSPLWSEATVAIEEGWLFSFPIFNNVGIDGKPGFTYLVFYFTTYMNKNYAIAYIETDEVGNPSNAVIAAGRRLLGNAALPPNDFTITQDRVYRGAHMPAMDRVQAIMNDISGFNSPLPISKWSNGSCDWARNPVMPIISPTAFLPDVSKLKQALEELL